MSGFAELMRRNDLYAATRTHEQATAMPSSRVFVVTCLDPRVEPAGFLGVETGDAIVLRNPGGRVTDEVISDISLISYMGEFMGFAGPPIEVAVVDHTQCGMGLLADDAFRSGFAARSGLDEADLSARAVLDPEVTVRHDVDRILGSPLTSSRIVVSGHVLDLATGRVRGVLAPASPA